MIIKKIIYSKKFKKELNFLSSSLVKLALAKETIFRDNPLHPSLRIHELHGSLKGSWTISVNRKYRIIFKRLPNGDIFFISIGKHDIYRCL